MFASTVTSLEAILNKPIVENPVIVLSKKSTDPEAIPRMSTTAYKLSEVMFVFISAPEKVLSFTVNTALFNGAFNIVIPLISFSSTVKSEVMFAV
ncbi:hypothetical protein D3C86_1787510 [compost metagenome]